MKLIAATFVLLLSGCAGLGDIEGTGRAGEILRSIDKTNAVLTGHAQRSINTGKINRAVGHTKALKQKIDGGYSWLYIVRDAQDLSKYIQ